MQNANNAISALRADFELQQSIGQARENERKIRLITTAHNTRIQWYTAWFYILGAEGKPEWYSKLIKENSFRVPEDNGFEILRRCNLNLQEYLNVHTLSHLKADLAKASRLGLNGTSDLGRENPASLTLSHALPNEPLVEGKIFEATHSQDANYLSDATRTNGIRFGTRSGRQYLKEY